MDTVRVGIIGCGKIAPAYIAGMKDYSFLSVEAVADLDMDRARAFADEHGIARALTVEALLAAPEIEIVVNLTVPKAHAPVNRAILEAGKHAYVEKPLAMNREEAAALLGEARKRNLRLGAAPDTFLGGGIQTCRKLIDDGAIGRPVAATALFACPGHESWHPNPKFYYEQGGGPLWDMGPYYITALVHLLGPATRVSGSAKASYETRTITSQPLAGTVIPVETATHVSGTIDFAGGAMATLLMSFDVWHHNLPRIEIYGTEGSLVVPDPNCFDGEVRLRRAGEESWTTVPLTHRGDIHRGTGVAEMARAIRLDRPHRASGELAAHVVDIMQAFDDSSAQERHIHLAPFDATPAPLPAGLARGELD